MARGRALERGVTLAEVLVIMAIVATLFAMAVPVIQNSDHTGSAVRMVISDAMRSRSYAQRAWETVTLQMDVTNDRWRTLKQDGTPLTKRNDSPDGWSYLPSGVGFEPSGTLPSDIVFLPNGRAQNDAAVRVVKNDSVWVMRGDALTGRISADRVQN